jgi:hypothetical protein
MCLLLYSLSSPLLSPLPLILLLSQLSHFIQDLLCDASVNLFRAKRELRGRKGE